jgi:hypothetical protein
MVNTLSPCARSVVFKRVVAIAAVVEVVVGSGIFALRHGGGESSKEEMPGDSETFYISESPTTASVSWLRICISFDLKQRQ